MALSRFGAQIAEVVAALNAIGAGFALIGGLALASHKVVRATQDVDLLVDAGKADDIETRLAQLGCRRLHRSADAANYGRGAERLDLLYAWRLIARRLLEQAAEVKTALGDLRVVSAEGLIGFKLQGFANDPGRTQDLEDIRALLRGNRAALDMEEVPGTFDFSTANPCSMNFSATSAEAPFASEGGLAPSFPVPDDPYRMLDDLMAVIEALCRVWPRRDTFAAGATSCSKPPVRVPHPIVRCAPPADRGSASPSSKWLRGCALRSPRRTPCYPPKPP